MANSLVSLIDRLEREGSLPQRAFERLIAQRTPQLAAYAAQRAVAVRTAVYGKDIFARGLIEFTNYCKNDCLYCGIRRSNRVAQRFRLDPQTILDCADRGYDLGYRTFVLQGGEDPYFTDDRLCALVSALRAAHPDCAITLSVGERSRASYERLFAAGADRYLLRHETATPAHYAQLHPSEMTLANRMRCLQDLRDVGFAVGCGFMVGSPFQSPAHLAADLAFIQEFRPDMCGLGPFIPHARTPFAQQTAGTLELTLLMLSLVRLIHPTVLLPATTALGTIDPQGRQKGILAGANVVMPNISPTETSEHYNLYDNKLRADSASRSAADFPGPRLAAMGYKLVVDRGDVRPKP